MHYFIGVEGISQRCSVAVLAESSGQVLSVHRLPQSLSLHTTPQSVLRKRIFQLLVRVLTDAHLTTDALEETIVCVGLSGTTFSYDREVILPNILRGLDLPMGRLVCTGDAEIIFASHTQSSSGSAILCHCGSTAYVVGRDAQRLNHARFGGWGPVLGDEGSAYHMGKKVLRQLALEHDTRQTEYSVLWQEVNDWLGRKDFTLNEWIRGSIYWRELTNDFNQWVQRTQHPHDPRTLIFYFAHRLSSSSDSEGMNEGIETLRRIASGLVTPLVAAKDRGDAVAKEILAAGILDLVEQHRQAVLAAKTLFQEAAIAPLVLYGGVFDHNPQFRLDLADRINSTYQTQLTPITASSPEAMRPVLGALLFALGDSSTGDLVLPDRKTIDSVVTSARSHQFATGLSND